MEIVMLAVIGIAALGYLGYTVWRTISGKSSCSCGNEASCRTKGGGCCSRKLP